MTIACRYGSHTCVSANKSAGSLPDVFGYRFVGSENPKKLRPGMPPPLPELIICARVTHRENPLQVALSNNWKRAHLAHTCVGVRSSSLAFSISNRARSSFRTCMGILAEWPKSCRLFLLRYLNWLPTKAVRYFY